MAANTAKTPPKVTTPAKSADSKDKATDNPKVDNAPVHAEELKNTGLSGVVTPTVLDAVETKKVVESQEHGKENLDNARELAAEQAHEDANKDAIDANKPVDITPRPDLGIEMGGLKGCIQALYAYAVADNIYTRHQALSDLHTTMKKAGVKIPEPVRDVPAEA